MTVLDKYLEFLFSKFMYDMDILSNEWMYIPFFIPFFFYMIFFFIKWYILLFPVTIPLSVLKGFIKRTKTKNSPYRNELEKIINSYKWIKVKKFEPENFKEKTYKVEDYEKAYDDLLEHHKQETEFLIDKCRSLAKELLSYNK